MGDCVCFGGAGFQGREVGERAVVDEGAGFLEGRGGFWGAGEAEDLVAGVEEFADEG